MYEIDILYCMKLKLLHENHFKFLVSPPPVKSQYLIITKIDNLVLFISSVLSLVSRGIQNFLVKPRSLPFLSLNVIFG